LRFILICGQAEIRPLDSEMLGIGVSMDPYLAAARKWGTEMKWPKLIWILAIFAAFLLGQRTLFGGAQKCDADKCDPQLVARGREIAAAMNATNLYCADLEKYSKGSEPRLFAQARSNWGTAGGWMELSGKAEWKRAGRPMRIAWVWSKGTKVVQVAMAFDGKEDGETSYAEYCYRPDGRLARLKTLPELESECDEAYFSCGLTVGIEFVYLPDGQKVRAWQATDQRFLRSEKTSATLTEFVPPEYLTVDDLPFARLIRSIS
jgi:hypothetical protein